MAITRIINCSMCGKKEQEKEENAGWQGWFCIQGVVLNGTTNPHICTDCGAKIMNFVDAEVKHGVD